MQCLDIGHTAALGTAVVPVSWLVEDVLQCAGLLCTDEAVEMRWGSTEAVSLRRNGSILCLPDHCQRQARSC